MATTLSTGFAEGLQETVYPLAGEEPDYDPLLDLSRDARIVLLGEASHGTHEFYRERARITGRLIRETGFTAVAVEADWPDAWRVNRYIRGQSDDRAPESALAGFERFPAWMWRNREVAEFVAWLRAYNDTLAADHPKVGFYGLDLYSLYSSMAAVIRYLEQVDADAARRARYRYGCFEDFGEDAEAYGYAAGFDLDRSCENEAVAQLAELRERAFEYAQSEGRAGEDDFFDAEQNARLARNAEHYYRSMFQGRVSAWNLRDRHMAETLEALLAYLDRRRETPARVVVWEHNSHIGDARATELSGQGELNVGRLVRERHAREAVLVGFSTYEGTVTAASEWGGPAEYKCVRPALPDSYEALFHGAGVERFLLTLAAAPAELEEPRLERAIGVIYRPQTERLSHYFSARLASQFDAVVHCDRTRAVEPLERAAAWGEMQTFPMGV